MKRKTITYTLVLLLAIGLRSGLEAQNMVPLKAKAALDTTAIMIGDQIGLNLSVEAPDGSQVQWPPLPDTLVPHVEIIQRGKTDTVHQNNALIMRRHLIITSFDSGYFNITPLHFAVKLPGKNTPDTVSTQDLFLQVYTPQVDTSKAFKPIVGPEAEPYTLGEILRWILLGLLVIGGIVFLIWYLHRRKKNQPLFVRKRKPKLPPDVEAIQRLEEIRLSRLWQAGKLKAYHSAITDIMRDYFARRFGIDAREMTTGEIIRELEKEPVVNKEVLSKVKSAFELADLVKFAKLKPSPLENDTSLNYCIDFVNETRETPPEPVSAEGDDASDKQGDVEKGDVEKEENRPGTAENKEPENQKEEE
jgi:hypothetical protein